MRLEPGFKIEWLLHSSLIVALWAAQKNVVIVLTSRCNTESAPMIPHLNTTIIDTVFRLPVHKMPPASVSQGGDAPTKPQRITDAREDSICADTQIRPWAPPAFKL